MAIPWDSPVLALDEPTTGLDALAARRMVVLEDGRITETGRHAELLAWGGTYARLYGSGRETTAYGRAG